VKGLLLSAALLLPLLAVADSTISISADARFDAANKLYAQSKFVEATAEYNKLVQAGSVSPALYFNLGNAFFKSGQIGRAIGAYRQAEEMSPRDPDVRANLQFARNLVPGPKLGAGRIQRWLGTLSTTEWVALSTVAVWVTLGLLIACLIKPPLKPALRSWIWLSIGTTIAIFACARTAVSLNASHKIAIVAVPEASIRNGPFDESPASFTAHDGAELRVLDKKDNWLQVTDGKTRVGWLKLDALVWSPRT
jgi:tetratricopeptide (TPR) repeat protein